MLAFYLDGCRVDARRIISLLVRLLLLRKRSRKLLTLGVLQRVFNPVAKNQKYTNSLAAASVQRAPNERVFVALGRKKATCARGKMVVAGEGRRALVEFRSIIGTIIGLYSYTGCLILLYRTYVGISFWKNPGLLRELRRLRLFVVELKYASMHEKID